MGDHTLQCEHGVIQALGCGSGIKQLSGLEDARGRIIEVHDSHLDPFEWETFRTLMACPESQQAQERTTIAFEVGG